VPKPKHHSDEHVEAIRIHGAREHNLKNLSLAIPRNQFVVITGVSGSGKSTLAFDLLFAEGQRRFLDSMNTYARQFVEQLSRPDVDLITGIPPTVSIEQRTTRGGGKSTVATVTEIYHFVRLLFARLGTQFCPDCQVPVAAQTRDELGRKLRGDLRRRGDLLLLAPVVKNRKGFHTDVAEWAAQHGYAEIRADGKMYSTAERLRLDRFREHDVEIVVGVLERSPSGARTFLSAATRQRTRAGENSVASVFSEVAADRNVRAPARRASNTRKAPQQLIDETLKLGQGTLFALDNAGTLSVHSTERACPRCGRSFQPLDPKMFSYNSSQGWCPKCRGFGELFYLPEVDRGARADAIEESWFGWQEGQREPCPDCHGTRLNPIARAVRLVLDQMIKIRSKIKNGRATSLNLNLHLNPLLRGDCRWDACPTIDTLAQFSVENAFDFFRSVTLKSRDALIARDILPEIRERLKFLREVGLGYLQLGRGVTTLSSGESQRIRLAAQLGSNLSGVLYVLDEPTIGLHARDNEQLLFALDTLRSRGNSLVVVEHDEATMRHADHIIDLGPRAGIHGGELVASGTLTELLRHPESITGQCLRAKKSFPARGQRRLVSGEKIKTRMRIKSKDRRTAPHLNLNLKAQRPDASTHWLTLRGAKKNNLKNLSVAFPLNRFVVVTGVSGSGKSTLVRECLLPALEFRLKKSGARQTPAVAGSLDGYQGIHAVYEVDQSPIGRTPRSTPATYIGFFDEIRALFAQTPEARLRGYSPSRFSFNSKQGRCPQCEGAGNIKLEMNFLPPAFVRCETCQGTRFDRETLAIEYRGRNIAQVLEFSVEEALEFFASFTKIRRPLEALRDTGLEYLRLGQTSPTLSGGEAQRLKLVTHLQSGLRRETEESSRPEQPVSGKVGEWVSGKVGGTRPTHPLTHSPTHFLRPRRSSLFILEEPTIGLHIADVRRLVDVLQRLVDAGHSVIVIEHNLDLIAEADWVIDLGPEGGEAGGQVVVAGSPETVARNKHSHTGRFLRSFLTAS